MFKTEEIQIWVETADLGEKWNLTDPTAEAINAGANMNRTDVKVNGDYKVELTTPDDEYESVELNTPDDENESVELTTPDDEVERSTPDAGVTSKEGDSGVKWKKPGSRRNRDNDMSSGLAGYKSYMKRYRRY